MSGREELELLCSRHFDGDLDAAEQARLDAALATDAELRELFESLRRAHQGVALLAEMHPLPADFTRRVMGALDEAAHDDAQAPVHVLPNRRWSTIIAAAAAIVLAIGLVFGASYLNGPQSTVVPPVARGGNPDRITPPVETPDARPTAELVAYSDSKLRVTDGAGAVREQKDVRGRVILPATVHAPADTHAVIQVGGGTAVLPPGASARLTDLDADGVPNLETVEGDLYLESGDRKVRSRVNNIRLSVRKGGITLRRADRGMVIEPSFGEATVGEHTVTYRQRAVVSADEVEINAFPNPVLDGWAVDGRLDAIKQQLRAVLGDKHDQFMAESWPQFDKMLRGILSSPAESAANAMMMRFFVKHGWLDDRPEAERTVFLNIADIIGQGTTEQDVPVQVRQMFAMLEAELQRDPNALREFARMMREALERKAERHRKRGE